MTIKPLGEQGFSLIEMLISITILSIGLFAVATMQTVAISNTALSNRTMTATELASQAMEDILSWDPANAALNASAANVVYANGVKVTGGGTFNITYQTTINTPAIGTTRIDIIVTELFGASGINRPISPIMITGFRKVV